MCLAFARGLLIVINVLGQEVFARPATGKPKRPEHPLQSHSSLYRRQKVVAVPPVATSIREGPYLPPANAENELLVGPTGIPSPLHRGYPSLPEPYISHLFPYVSHAIFHGFYSHPSYHPMIPWGLHHGYYTHWPPVRASRPVFLADPNDGMYQEPVTGTVIPRPLIPPQYPGFYLNHALDMYRHNHLGSMFLGMHGARMYPVDVTKVEDQILDNSANLHNSPREDAAKKMEEIRKETELERQKLMEAMKLNSADNKVKKH